MSLSKRVRGLAATATVVVCAALAMSPGAGAASKPSGTGLGAQLELSPALQLAAMNTAIKAAPGFFTGHTSDCKTTTAVLAAQSGSVMAGNFHDADGNCYVWLNLEQSSMLTGSDICKIALHEMGHLNGLEHSQDRADVMFSPYQADPIPPPCQTRPVVSTAKAKKSVRRARRK